MLTPEVVEQLKRFALDPMRCMPSERKRIIEILEEDKASDKAAE